MLSQVLGVDPERKRISLTAKKTLVDSTLSIITKPEDITIGLVTHAMVFKIYDKHLLVEFYNNMKAIVPSKEIRLADPTMLALTNSNIFVVIPQRANSKKHSP